jgi:phage terminase large subunit-like protein
MALARDNYRIGKIPAIAAYATHRADRIVAEVNNGGDMVGATLRMVDPNVAFTAVRASRGKVVRAEPVAALYQQGRVHHIGTFPQLEDQMKRPSSPANRNPKPCGSPAP